MWANQMELFMDNAGKTNKNIYVLAFLQTLVSSGRLDAAFMSFMIPGHTKVFFFVSVYIEIFTGFLV
jgi:hypothetical protein